MQSAAVHLQGITLKFNDAPLFDDFSLAFAAGRCTCLLGRSGCGKSTLLGIISGNRSLSYTGQVYFQPETDSGMISWMAQSDLLLPWLKVIDNVLLGAKLRFAITPELRQQARELLREAGLVDYENALPDELSGGMRQRVALLRTLMEERPVMIMDEPFSALDALTRMKLQDLTSRLVKGKTLIMVTHDPLEALKMADRIVVLGQRPTKVLAEFNLDGGVPRDLQSREFLANYPVLLAQLMAEE